MTALAKPVLILNRNWQPVHVATLKRAMILLFKQAARVVDPADYQLFTWDDWSKLRPADGDDFIQAANFRLKLPEVVLLSRYSKHPERDVTFSRRNVFKRDNFKCMYCGCVPGVEELTLDHVNPRAAGGISQWENLVCACVRCNKRKSARTPEQAGMSLLRKPVQPKWKPLYANHSCRRESWRHFLSEAYWTVELRP